MLGFPDVMFGMGMIAESLLCKSPEFVRWKKTHRQKRIRMK